MQQLPADPQLIMLALLAVIVLALAVLVFRRPGEAKRAAELAAELSRAEARARHLDATLAGVTDERDTLRDTLAEAQTRAARLEAERDSAQARLDAAAQDHAAKQAQGEQSHAAATAKLDAQLKDAQAELARLRDSCAALTTDKRVLEETLAAQKRKHAELTAEIEANRTDFVNQFKAISAELLQSQGKATTESQKAELEKLLTPFKQELGHLRTGLKEMTEKAEKDRQSLGQQIQAMQLKASELSAEANSLTLALRGDRKRQGDWGETILARVLEAAGLVDGTHFTRQAIATDAEGKRLIPDIVVHLPGQRDVIIDSKVTLTAYQDMVQAADQPEQEEAALRRHVAALRAHIAALAKKSYDSLGFDNIDSVLMFLPVEGALSAALTQAPDLVLEAAEKRIHILTPSTLMPILKIVDHLWTIDSRNRNVDDIVERVGRLHDKFAAVVESIDDIGKHLRKASDSQAEAVKRMSQGPGNVLRQVDQLRALGAKSRKTLPGHMRGDADDPDDPTAGDDPAAP